MLEKIKKLIPLRIFRALQPPYHFIFSWLASLVYWFPSRRLIVIGITGTAGKTSTLYLTAKMLQAAGYKTGFTSTAVFSDGEREWLNDRKMTMPGRLFIQKFLRRMARNRCRYAIVETTSEGVKQFRHRFINYDVLLFTSLYPEHIESHGSFAKYRAAKGKLFAHIRRGAVKYVNAERLVVRPHSAMKKLDLSRVPKTIIVNGDDENAGYFLNFWSEAKLVYSFRPGASRELFLKQLNSAATVSDFTLVQGDEVAATAQGTSLTVNGQPVQLQLLGKFNADNALAASAIGLSQNIPLEKIKTGLETVRALAGKLERIDAGQNFTAIVDYSFEPKAVEKLYETAALLPHNRIIHLLGSTGGGRDKSRRPILGRLAGAKADLVIVTDEDPYDENPADIINQVAAGAELAGKELNKDLFKILDRREAIKKALELAKKGDLLLFTGKGAEQYICLANGAKMPWDEREVVLAAIVDKLGIDKIKQI
jgi:UDP-N-acetylmuramoyl-L-alanyl-D-glutamate--2,6-diaminopimelate ligase